jgi:formate dehydrogenase subunit gamma
MKNASTFECAGVPTYEPWSAERTAQIIAEHRGVEGSLLPILHAVQDAFGCVPEDAVPVIAQALNLSRAEVHGVVTFYHDFTSEPRGRRVLKICQAEACQAAGCEALAAHAQSRLGIDFGGTTADGRVTLEPVYCLGLCSVSPSAMLDGRIVARLDEKKLDALLAETDR